MATPAIKWVKIWIIGKLYYIGLTQLVGDGGVWAGDARPNTPEFPLNCVTSTTIDRFM